MTEENKNNNEINTENDIIKWTTPEYTSYEKDKKWYVTASIIAVLLLIYSFFTANIWFAVIIIISTVILILRHGEEITLLDVLLSDEGVQVGKNFYDYDMIKDFSVIYKPRENVKHLYFEFKNSVRPRLSIPLDDMNPIPIRESLQKYLSEDLERTNPPLSEQLSRILRL